MLLTLNHDRLKHLLEKPFPDLSPEKLYRRDTVFFIGGNLPVYETLETMYESYCLESTDLFHVTFADREDLERNLEMVRQIKKNFTVRLMGRINFEIPVPLLEHTYLAGLDLLDIPDAGPHDGNGDRENRVLYFRSAAGAFPRWSIVSSLGLGIMTADELRDTTDGLLALGIVPLPVIDDSAAGLGLQEVAAALKYVSSAWRRHDVPIRRLLPLVRLVSPLDLPETSGFIRTVINRIQDRHLLATSDLRRHLRTSGAEASFESAGL